MDYFRYSNYSEPMSYYSTVFTSLKKNTNKNFGFFFDGKSTRWRNIAFEMLNFFSQFRSWDLSKFAPET